ncbi:MAG: diacylglycerol/lipid kinase family protein [Actinomycetota bacterium]
MSSTPAPTRAAAPSGHLGKPADRPQRPVLFVNPRSGDGKAARTRLVDRARERGIEVVVLTPDRDLTTMVADAVARGADALGMAGGDGSLALVAAAAVANGLSFTCVPAGTRNHFARDVGLDRRDPVAALDAFSDGIERRIDVAEVNGRMFLNNVSLGIYGDAVRRPRYRGAKLQTLLETADEVLGPSAAVSGLRLVDDLGHEHTDPVVVLVSNNQYGLDRPPAPGTRPRLDSGRLGVVVLDAPQMGRRPRGRAWSTTTIVVDGPGPIHAGIDGEAVDLTPPLEFVIRPAALRVRIPARPPEVLAPRRPWPPGPATRGSTGSDAGRSTDAGEVEGDRH